MRLRPFLSAVALAISIAALGCAGQAYAGGSWEFLGERVVNDRLDHDSIPVTARRGDFEAIKLAVLRAPVRFVEVVIHFGNGSEQRVALRGVIPAGGETRVIDVEGHDRVIRSVEFVYEAETRRRGRRAAVRLYGRR